MPPRCSGTASCCCRAIVGTRLPRRSCTPWRCLISSRSSWVLCSLVCHEAAPRGAGLPHVNARPCQSMHTTHGGLLDGTGDDWAFAFLTVRLTALLLAGRIGGSYAGEVGMMAATHQLELLSVLGVPRLGWTFVPVRLASRCLLHAPCCPEPLRCARMAGDPRVARRRSLAHRHWHFGRARGRCAAARGWDGGGECLSLSCCRRTGAFVAGPSGFDLMNSSESRSLPTVESSFAAPAHPLCSLAHRLSGAAES